MADITHPPTPHFATPDELTVRATASLQAMHDRVLAEGDIDPFTHAILMLIRAIIAYLAIPLEQTATSQPSTVPHATTPSIRQCIQAIRAESRRARTRCALRSGPRARPTHPTTDHQTTQRSARIIHRAPLLPDLPQAV